MAGETDRLEKNIVLRAPRQRVWQALTDAVQFGSWFGVQLDAPFRAGQTVTGKRVAPSVDPDARPPSDWRDIQIDVESIEPERRVSFRWHPFAHDRRAEYSTEPRTLVVFTLADVPEGILLTVAESGFDAIPPSRRREAFGSHVEGWPVMLDRVGKYLDRG